MARAPAKRRDDAATRESARDVSGVHRRSSRRDRSANAKAREAERPSHSGVFSRLVGRSSAPPASEDTGRNRRLVVKNDEKKRNEHSDVAPTISLRVRMIEARASARRLWFRVRRPIVFVGRLLLVLALLAAAVAVGRLVERHVRTSPAFATKEIGIVGLERLERDAVLGAAGLSLGQNVFDVAPEEAETALRSHPWIADARVTRRLPGSFDVVVREHHPVAVLSILAVDDSPTRLYLVAEDGTVFKEVEPGDPVDLPVVTGLDHATFTSDAAFRASIVLEVVALLHDYRGAGLHRREPIHEIHVESDDGLSLYVGTDAMYVRLGRGPYRQKLSRLRRVLDRLRREEARAAYVYLDNVRRPDRVTVRLRD
jgi:cell division protein FtsQ